MKGLLVRVGIDSTDGQWNAPILQNSNEFVYITITDSKPMRDGLATSYNEFVRPLSAIGVSLPLHLQSKNTHLDPDFKYLTYGDQGQRAKQISSYLSTGDLLVFFSSFKPLDEPKKPLVYAIIGIFKISEIIPANLIPTSRWHENAHTRRHPTNDDIVVRADKLKSGRLRHCIPIGELRNKAYRVRNDILEKWGGLSVKDGYIQRSARLPAFQNAELFYEWFKQQHPELISENNIL